MSGTYLTPLTVNDFDTFGVCWICNDPSDHEGRSHSEATGDTLTRYDVIAHLHDSADTKYVVRGGWVTSRSDGDRHFVTVPQLVRLYELEAGEYVVWSERSRWPKPWPVLGPRRDGRYGRPS